MLNLPTELAQHVVTVALGSQTKNKDKLDGIVRLLKICNNFYCFTGMSARLPDAHGVRGGHWTLWD